MAGHQYEGEAVTQTPADALALRAWSYLSNGSGGIDFGGLPLVVELLGVDDVEDLMHRLLVIKTHDPDRKD